MIDKLLDEVDALAAKRNYEVIAFLLSQKETNKEICLFCQKLSKLEKLFKAKIKLEKFFKELEFQYPDSYSSSGLTTYFKRMRAFIPKSKIDEYRNKLEIYNAEFEKTYLQLLKYSPCGFCKSCLSTRNQEECLFRRYLKKEKFKVSLDEFKKNWIRLAKFTPCGSCKSCLKEMSNV